jgi:hypothetical protein
VSKLIYKQSARGMALGTTRGIIGDVDTVHLHKIDELTGLIERLEILNRAPAVLINVFKPTEMALSTVKLALYGACLTLIAEIAESI